MMHYESKDYGCSMAAALRLGGRRYIAGMLLALPGRGATNHRFSMRHRARLARTCHSLARTQPLKRYRPRHR